MNLFPRSHSASPLVCLLGFLLCLVSSRCGAADWPQWRGVQRDGQVAGEAPPASLSADLKPLWRLPVGPGLAAPVVAGDTLVYLDEQSGQETVHIVSASNGKVLRQTSFAEGFGDEWGRGPRSTPVLDGDRVYVQSCMGEFRCLNLSDLSTRWRTHFEKDFGVIFVGTKVLEGAAIRRGHNGSAVIDGDRILVPVGSTNGATFVCFDKRTGTVLWKSMSEETAYSSPVISTLAGIRQLVALTADSLVGIQVETGRLLWRFPIKTAAKRHALTPVVLGDDRVVVASHSYGMVCVQVVKSTESLTVKQLWLNRELKVNLSTPTRSGSSLFGFGGTTDYLCINPDTGAIRWSQPGFGKGAKTDFVATIAVGDKLITLNEAGQLSLLAASPEKFESLGQVQVCGKTWSHPAYARGRIYVRDGRELQCFALTDSK
ncbi:MAG: PQQ-binding-like beta-propeller repeat protein [Verrucomicrobiales bacterium]|nr:PQQ-binding-like beta-propeller repeat protein [Verrucomicrobiales bacterium]